MNVTEVPTFYYNRSDMREIQSLLSPYRPRILKAIPVLYYIGLFTNALSIFVLLQKQLIYKKSIFYLAFLAFSDLMYNLLAQLPDFLTSLKLVNDNFNKQSNVACFFYDLNTTTFHFYSIILTLFVTSDRFIYIYRPLKLNRSFESIKSKLVLGVSLFFVSLIVALPHGFLMVYNEAEKDCDAREFFKRKLGNTSFTYYQLYFTFTEPILIWVTPGLLILIMNAYVIYKIFKSNRFTSKTIVGGYRGRNILNTNSKLSATSTQVSKFNLAAEVEMKELNETDHMLNGGGRSPSIININQMLKKLKNRTDDSSGRRASVNSNIVSASGKISKINVNQISHYVTIITLGFYFIVTTIPHGVLLTLSNNLTLKLNYFLASKEEYLSDPLWVKYGTYREFTALSKCFFVSNHCLNFFFYIVFNQMFRNTLLDLLKQACSYLSFKLRLGWCVNRFKNCCNRSISN